MPVFIGGMFKSGTSLARKYIGNHPKIFSGLETNWFEFDKYFAGSNFDINFKINVWSSFFKIDKEIIENIIQESKCSEEILDKLMNLISKKNNFYYWSEKSPPNISFGDRIIKYWKDPKIIHIIRDPLDVYSSCKQAKKWNEPEIFVETWSKIFKHTSELRKSKNYLEIHYEHIILDKINSLNRMFTFCGLDWDKKYSQHSQDKSEYSLVKKITGKDSTTLKRLGEPITKERIGIGKKFLSFEEKDKIRELVIKKNLLVEYNHASNY